MQNRKYSVVGASRILKNFCFLIAGPRPFSDDSAKCASVWWKKFFQTNFVEPDELGGETWMTRRENANRLDRPHLWPATAREVKGWGLVFWWTWSEARAIYRSWMRELVNVTTRCGGSIKSDVSITLLPHPGVPGPHKPIYRVMRSNLCVSVCVYKWLDVCWLSLCSCMCEAAAAPTDVDPFVLTLLILFCPH